MSKLARVFQKQFGVNAGASDVGIFGSLAASNPQYSKDPETIQSLNAFLTGWAAETIANNRPALEDFNAIDYLTFYQICYLLQQGVAEWDADTTYYEGSICQVAGVLYRSLDDDNIDNDPTTEADKWEEVVSDFVPSASNALSGSVVQTVNYQTGTPASGSTEIPADDTVPQITEGNACMSLDITPTDANNYLDITVVAHVGTYAHTYHTIALFKNSTASAIAASQNYCGGAHLFAPLVIKFRIVAGTTSSINFSVRFGIAGFSTSYFNRANASDGVGGVMSSSITITEIKV